jgi:hypothetical protein
MFQPPALTPRAQEMLPRIEKYLASNLSQKAFCAQEGLAYQTFRYWLRQYRTPKRRQKNLSPPPTGFIPLQVHPPTPSLDSHPRCVIEFSHGVIVRLSGPLDWQRLSQLIGR